MLDTNLSTDVSVNMFTHSVGRLFILLMVSFSVQNLFSLMKYHLFIFFLLFPLPRVIGQKKNIATRNVQGFTAYVSF